MRWLDRARGDAGHFFGRVYDAIVVDGELRAAFDETDACGWFTIEEAPSLSRVGLVEFVLGLVC